MAIRRHGKAIYNVSGIDIALRERFWSLTEAQATSIASALDDTWSIDRIVSYDDTLALLLTPPGGVDAGVSCYVDADEGGLNLSFMQDDDLRLRGCYCDSVEVLLSAIRAAC